MSLELRPILLISAIFLVFNCQQDRSNSLLAQWNKVADSLAKSCPMPYLRESAAQFSASQKAIRHRVIQKFKLSKIGKADTQIAEIASMSDGLSVIYIRRVGFEEIYMYSQEEEKFETLTADSSGYETVDRLLNIVDSEFLCHEGILLFQFYIRIKGGI